MLQKFIIKLSESESARRIMTQFEPARRTARRFVAGETLDEAIAVVKELNGRGIKGLINEVGECVTTRENAVQASRVCCEILHRIHTERIDSTISLKPSHVGMGLGADFCYDNLAEIVKVAQKLDNVVEIDIEASPDVPATLSLFHRLLDNFERGVCLAIQAYLHRSLSDAESIARRGGSLRLVKGAYNESPEIAYKDKAKISEAAIALMQTFLTQESKTNGAYLALGSHDPLLIEWLVSETRRLSIPKDQFEFQMLLGIRRDEQQRLADLGYRMRIYVPYGTAWYPYFMRRMAERPANFWFFANSLWRK